MQTVAFQAEMNYPCEPKDASYAKHAKYTKRRHVHAKGNRSYDLII